MVTFLSIFTTGLVGFALPSWGARFPLPLLPGGIAVAATFRWGRRMWAPIFAASAAIQLWLNQPPLAAAASGAGLAAGALVSNWLLGKSGFDPAFGRARDVPIFIFAVALGMTVAPTIGIAGAVLAGVPYASSGLVRWLRWWSNIVSGVLLVGPALIAIDRRGVARFARHWLDGALWIIGVLVCCWVIARTPGPAGRSVVVMSAMLLMAVGTIRFGLAISALGAIAISSTTAFSFAFGVGLFGKFDELPGRFTLFSFNATLVTASLLITALLSERDAAGAGRLRAERRYAQIFYGSPQAVWVHDPVTRRFLLANEAAQRQYGWTLEEFLARDIGALAPPGEPRILPAQTGSDGATRVDAAPFETRHVTRDGRILEVEVWMRSIDFGG
ncbi:MAG: hypothetical protein JWN43_5024, partial [Gammaproteobacteria bacterium]|nr:hypothetical protein [Gammaproteobacteria bacterium]